MKSDQTTDKCFKNIFSLTRRKKVAAYLGT